MEVAPGMIHLNVTPGHKSHFLEFKYDSKGKTSRFILLDSISRERLHRFPLEILSDSLDDLGFD